jgi:eukaryotic-like serine/threonine-protein kinase
VTLSDTVMRGLRASVGAPAGGEERYFLLQEIGRGGMGTVYRAQDSVLGREVALKVLNPGAAVLTEARVTAGLEHPGIVPVHDAGTLDDGRAFYAMKLVRGQRLDEWLHRGPSGVDRLNVFLRICEPVAFAHSRSVIHRDLKPANIMVGSFGEVLVLDWGIACPTGDAQTAGTPGFSAPEAKATEAADVYSLGRILGVMVADPVPGPLRSVCNRATTERPAGRYASVLDLASDVNRYLAGEPVLAHRENVIERGRRLLDKHRAMVGLLAAYLVMRAALLMYASLR